MTRFAESAHKTVLTVQETPDGWNISFVDGTNRFIKRNEKKGSTPIMPGVTIEPCRLRCGGPDRLGRCSLRPRGPRTNKKPTAECHKQFVYAHKPFHFDQGRPKFERGIQKMSYRIKSYRTIKPTSPSGQVKIALLFEDGSRARVLKSSILGHAHIQHGYYLVPCDQECGYHGDKCPHCHGARRGTECRKQFLFCHKILTGRKNHKTK